MKKITILKRSIIVCLLMGMLLSCGAQPMETAENVTSEQTVQTTAAEETEEEIGRHNTKDSLPDTLDFAGTVVRIHTRTGDIDVRMEFIAEEETGETVNDAVYARELSVEERLNVDLSVIENDVTRHNGAIDSLRKSIVAGSDDFEIAGDHMYRAVALMMDGMFLELNKLDYLDFSQSWWNTPFLEMTEYEGKNYMAMGELGQTMISGAYAIFYNQSLFQEMFPEEPSLYETVRAGDWTMDTLLSYCEDIYTDVNGNGEADEDDLYGNFYISDRTLVADAYVGGCRLDMLEKLADGSVVYNGTGERMVSFLEKMTKLVFENNNSFRYNPSVQSYDMMKNRKIMFAAAMLSTTEYLRDMKDDFGIIPMPKLDENQAKYVTYVHDGSTAFMLPKTETEPDIAAAVLEAMSAESYRTVTPAYFETALKAKYVRNEDSSWMLDLIVEGSYLDISIIFGSVLPEPINTMRKIFINDNAASKAVSTLAAKETSMLKSMDAILEDFAAIED